jgi:hypothetical protein
MDLLSPYIQTADILIHLQHDAATDYYGAPAEVYSPTPQSRHIETAHESDMTSYAAPPQDAPPLHVPMQQYAPPQPQPLQPYARPAVAHQMYVQQGSRSGFVTPSHVTQAPYGAVRAPYAGSRSMTHSGAATPTYAVQYSGGGAVPFSQWVAHDRRSYQGELRAPVQQTQQASPYLSEHQQLVEQHRAVEAHQRMMAQRQNMMRQQQPQLPAMQPQPRMYARSGAMTPSGYMTPGTHHVMVQHTAPRYVAISSVANSLAPSARNSPPLQAMHHGMQPRVPDMELQAAGYQQHPKMHVVAVEHGGGYPHGSGYPGGAPRQHVVYRQVAVPAQGYTSQGYPGQGLAPANVRYAPSGYASSGFTTPGGYVAYPMAPSRGSLQSYPMPTNMVAASLPRTPANERTEAPGAYVRASPPQEHYYQDRSVPSYPTLAGAPRVAEQSRLQQTQPTLALGSGPSGSGSVAREGGSVERAPAGAYGRAGAALASAMPASREDPVMTPNGTMTKTPSAGRQPGAVDGAGSGALLTRYDPDEAEARVRNLIADTERMLAGLSGFSSSYGPAQLNPDRSDAFFNTT